VTVYFDGIVVTRVDVCLWCLHFTIWSNTHKFKLES